MKTKNFKAMGAAVVLLLGTGVSSSAQAFVASGSLGVSPVATDVMTFNCPAGTTSVRGLIADTAPGAVPLVRLGLFVPGIMPTVQAPQEGVSIVVGLVPTGSGTHWAVVTKDSIGGENYSVDINCYNAAGAILPASGITLTQNQ